MDEIIFITTSKDGRQIRLTKTQWQHISFRHPEMVSKINEIKETIEDPIIVKQYSKDIYKFYRFLKEGNKYIMVAVKRLNGEGFIITSYLTKRV